MFFTGRVKRRPNRVGDLNADDLRVDRERGAVLVLLSLFLFIFLAVAALAVDLSALSARGQTVQNSADAAALAAVADYKEELLASGSEAAAEAAANAAVERMLIQNGLTDPNNPGSLRPGISWTIDFDPDGDALIVTVTDDDAQVFVGEVVDFRPSVTRRAKAEFFACRVECSYEVRIPKPFPSVRAKGFGDGYKPIPVGTRMYSLNHNSTGRHIVCVDRETAAPCWPSLERVAYSSSVGFSSRNPEMPHAAVVGTTIYWSASDASGHRLFCWETTTDTPCSTAVTLSTKPRGNRSVHTLITDRKDEDRGGGTVAVNGKIFVFTDDHRVHCYEPGVGLCLPNGGVDTALGAIGFPDNEPVDGNHGGSIDRIVDENTGYIYSSLHIPYAVGVTCSALDDPAGENVVLRNVATGQYVAAQNAGDEIFANSDGRPTAVRWDVAAAGSGTYTFRSIPTSGYLDSDSADGAPIGWSADPEDDDRWELVDFDAADGSVIFQNFDSGGYMTQVAPNADIVERTALPGTEGRWQILASPCGDPAYVPPPDSYTSGTWVHCFDSGTFSGLAQPCPGFSTALPMHVDATRFSGRLFFYYAADPTPATRSDNELIPKLGVCSSGYDQAFTDTADMDVNAIEVRCVDMAGNFSPGLTNNLVGLRDSIRSSTSTAPAAWGDPHWNVWDNRLFYPTEHSSPLIICWDFDSGACKNIVGVTPTGSALTEDYGFFSERNCVYALGHTANFWAFASDDPGELCEPQPARVPIKPCDCDTKLRWGRLDFSDVDLSRVRDFRVRIVEAGTDDPPVVAWPPTGDWYAVTEDNQNTLIDLEDLPTTGTDFELEVFAEYDGDPLTAPALTFTVRLTNVPHLTE